ncbi:BAG family molecular chaperone regulator 2-like isoform X2 [Physella acuta]|uniref:BAG family molecular chaperone regulator 2-like isoform X2 n=1 Tax=Physella acuta TaxID=109671 RepID=UPI0027DAFC7B|nr:BAG family molecular chaperone regulator 2-like isoform X2 [Physella acuta]
MTRSREEGEHQEICSTIERLKKRCKSVEIKIHTIRSAEQESAYKTVNSLVKDLEQICLQNESDDQTYSQLAQSYLNACVSDLSSTGPIDYKFQGMILGCRLEDQKQVRQRLECLVNGKCHVSQIEEEFTASAQNVEQSECLSKSACSSEKI